jgi:hypothetical protein
VTRFLGAGGIFVFLFFYFLSFLICTVLSCVTTLDICIVTLSVRTLDMVFDAEDIYTEDGLVKPKRLCRQCMILG